MGYALKVSRRILLGLPGEGPVGNAGDAGAGNDPSRHFPPLALLSAALGVLALLRGPQRQSAVALALLWLLTLGTLSLTLPVGWHRHRYLAPLWPLMLLGFVSTLQWLSLRSALTWARGLRAALLMLWLGFGALQWPWFLKMSFQGGASYAAANREAAFDLKRSGFEGRVAVEDAGLIAYYGGLPIVDLLGVTDHRLALLQDQGPDAVRGEVLRRLKEPGELIVLLHPTRTGSYSQLWVSQSVLKPLRTLAEMEVYRFTASETEIRKRAPRP
jgi:hypothetical protein